MRLLSNYFVLIAALTFFTRAEDNQFTGIRLTMTAPETVAAGSLIVVKTKLENVSEQNYFYNSSQPNFTFDVKRCDSKGDWCPVSSTMWASPRFRRSGRNATGLYPKDSIEIFNQLGILYDLTLPGKFKVRAQKRFIAIPAVVSQESEFTVTEPLFPIEDVSYSRIATNKTSEMKSAPHATLSDLRLLISTASRNVSLEGLGKVTIKLENVGLSAVAIPGASAIENYAVDMIYDWPKRDDGFKTEFYRNFKSKNVGEIVILGSKESMSLTIPFNFLFHMDNSYRFCHIQCSILIDTKSEGGRTESLRLRSNLMEMRACERDVDAKRLDKEDEKKEALKE